jgi:hypothetical protein
MAVAPNGVALRPSNKALSVFTADDSNTIWMQLNGDFYAELVVDYSTLDKADRHATLSLLEGILEQISTNGDLLEYDLSGLD